MLCPGSLAPCFVNNDYVTVEIIQSTANARQEVLDSLDHGLLCAVQIHELHLESSGITAASRLCPFLSPMRVENMVCLLLGLCVSQEGILPWLLHQPGERLCFVKLCYGCCYVSQRE